MSRIIAGFVRFTKGRGRRGLLAAGVCLSLSVCAPTVAAHHITASGASVLYRPSDPSQFAGYPRVIRLAHNGSVNGTLLATFGINVGGTDSLLIYRSADGGRSWSRLSTLADSAYGGRSCCETLFEVPRALGTTPAGTLLLAESAGAAGTVGHELKIFRSRDQGRTWAYLSSCAKGAGGMWEPDFQIDRAGRLVCYFSDERRVAYSQFLGHVVSADGGKTWGAERVDVAVPDGSSRPGMATVIRLPSSRYVMSFEVCGRTNCEVHLKTSADGDAWGNAADLGPRVGTGAGVYAGHTPYIAWAPEGGAHGEILLTSHDLYGRDDTVAPQSRRVLLVNRQDGTGPWSTIAAPVQVSQGGPDCANYSSALLPSPTGSGLFMLAAAGLDGGGCEIRYGRAPIGHPAATTASS